MRGRGGDSVRYTNLLSLKTDSWTYIHVEKMPELAKSFGWDVIYSFANPYPRQFQACLDKFTELDLPVTLWGCTVWYIQYDVDEFITFSRCTGKMGTVIILLFLSLSFRF